MNLRPTDLFRGSLVVARRDLAANLKSVRVLVLSVLTLLVLVAAAFGIRGLSPTGPGTENAYVPWAFPAYPEGNASLPAAVVRVTDYRGTPRPQLEVALGDPYLPGDPNPVFHVRATNLTDRDGWTRFANLDPGLYPLEIRVGESAFYTSVQIRPGGPSASFTAAYRQFDVIGDRSGRDVGLQAVLRSGVPLAGAEVQLNGTRIGETDGQGFFGIRLDPGLYTLNVTYAGETEAFAVVVRQPQAVLPFQLGPDFVLYFVANVLMGLFAPIVAIALSYDAMSKERAQGSLELLLVRPASRTGLAIGKFLGTFLSVGLPLVGVALGALAGVAAVTEKWPDLRFNATFLLATLGLIALYVLLMQIFSTLAKSAGTAILYAILVWLVFNLLWNFVYLAVSAALRIEGGTPEAFALSSVMLLFNPTGVFQLTLAAAFPPSLAAFGSPYGLPDWTGPAAFAVWLVVLLVLAVMAFQKKVV